MHVVGSLSVPLDQWCPMHEDEVATVFERPCDLCADAREITRREIKPELAQRDEIVRSVRELEREVARRKAHPRQIGAPCSSPRERVGRNVDRHERIAALSKHAREHADRAAELERVPVALPRQRGQGRLVLLALVSRARESPGIFDGTIEFAEVLPRDGRSRPALRRYDLPRSVRITFSVCLLDRSFMSGAVIPAPFPAGYVSNINVQTRQLGTTDLAITPLGFGAWAIGGADWRFGWGPQDDDDSIAAIRRAISLGVNWIDTAAAYGLGHSEEVVARALADLAPSDRPYVFTKCALVPDGQGGMTESLDPASLRRECEASLRRLRVDTIDLYQIHWPTDNIEDIDAGWSTLADLQREGKVRWIGVSNFNVAEMDRARKIETIASLQPPYSLVNRDIENDILPYCREYRIGVIVYSPMQSGLLSGGFTKERAAALPENDWRSRNPFFQEPKLSATLALVERLREIGKRHNASPGEVAIAWTLRDPVVTGAIVGARSADQVDGWIGAADLRLSEEEIAEIEASRVPA